MSLTPKFGYVPVEKGRTYIFSYKDEGSDPYPCTYYIDMNVSGK